MSTDPGAIAAALATDPEVHARDLMRLTPAGQRQVTLTRPVGEAAFDLDPDYVTTGRRAAADVPGSDDHRTAAHQVAKAIKQLVTECGLAVEYRLGERWHPVSLDSDIGRDGYGMACEQYLYRLTNG